MSSKTSLKRRAENAIEDNARLYRTISEMSRRIDALIEERDAEHAKYLAAERAGTVAVQAQAIIRLTAERDEARKNLPYLPFDIFQKCPACQCGTFARVENGDLSPSPVIRCVDCKRDYLQPIAEADFDAMGLAVVNGAAMVERAEKRAEKAEAKLAEVEHVKAGVLEDFVESQKEVARLQKDAARYQWLRQQNWNDGKLAVVADPKNAVKLGHDCPSLLRLDAAIDAAIQGGK